ncbi:hypothetical protein [Streptomyces sp. NPDC060031]|uniref:hypothetical protein n=1 Tax=Streptomyces sp. NPDC060031 TaxID=3347043 RepID=UPI003683329E
MATTCARKALFTGLVGTATALAAAATLGVAYAGPQSAVEDFAYPNAVRTDDLGQWIATTGEPLLIRAGQVIASGSTGRGSRGSYSATAG